MEDECSECHDTGIVKEKNGQVHTCWKCLKKGKFNVHSETVPDSKVKI